MRELAKCEFANAMCVTLEGEQRILEETFALTKRVYKEERTVVCMISV